MLIPVFDHFQTHAKKKQSDQTLRRSLGFAEMTETGGGSSSPSSPSGGHFKLYEPLEQQEFPDKYVIRSVEAPDQGFVISCRDGAIEPLIAGAEADSSPKKPSKTSTIYGVVGMIRLLAGCFLCGGRIGKKAVQQNYASVLTELILQLGSCHGLAKSGQHEPLRVLLTAFQVFCECVGDLEMGNILARDGEKNENERWINLIGDIAGCISIKRPKEVQRICVIFSKSLIRHQRYQREAAGAALSEFIRYREMQGGDIQL